jgi:hypothetical protein
MANKILSKDQFKGFLEKLARDYKVYAPAWDGGKMVWTGLDQIEEPGWDFFQYRHVAQGFFLSPDRMHDALQG